MKVMVPVSAEKALVESSLSDVNPASWSPSANYAVQATVTRAGLVYVAKVANTAKYPEREPEIWAELHPATPALWIADTAYAAGDIVCYKQQRYSSLKASNLGYLPDTAAEWWSRMGPVNSWAAFDRSINTKSAAVNEIFFEMAFSGCNGIAMFGLEAASVRIEITNSAGYTVLTRDIVLAGVNATSWLQYFIDPLTPREDVVDTSLPVMAYSRLKLTISAPAGIVRVGQVAVGRVKYIGQTLYEAENGISDYSRKTTDSFGNTYLSVGGWAKEMRLDLHIVNSVYDDIFRTLAKLRATPTVFVGDNRDKGFDTLTVWGFVRDFRMVVKGPSASKCALEIQGLI